MAFTRETVGTQDLTTVDLTLQATKMAICSAMTDRLDREIGRVLDQLRAMGAMEKTVVFFASDNGASPEIMVRDGGHDPAAPPGSAKSYLCLNLMQEFCVRIAAAGHQTSCR